MSAYKEHDTITVQTETFDFKVDAPFEPAGDQAQAIKKLSQGLNDGLRGQVLLGVTGSGKTYTIAKVVEQVQRPTLVMAPNKTLAAQLFSEFKEFFPKNAVEYFVSYYDYYQPEAYVPSSDTYIAKDSSINDHIDQLRLSATKSLLEREDTIIVATVSAIYGLGAPDSYLQMTAKVSCGDVIDRRALIKNLVTLQYKRNDITFKRGTYRVRGECIDIYPADAEDTAIRIELCDDVVESIRFFDPLTGRAQSRLNKVVIYPTSHYVTPRERVVDSIKAIKDELKIRLAELNNANKLVEAQRLEERVRHDVEMMKELGYCSGIENYSRYLSGRQAGQAPPTLFDYFPSDGLVVVDESHVTIPQIGGMYKGDRSRKTTLVEYGFRLPSALDNRPLRFEEWQDAVGQIICVSATPREWEFNTSDQVVEQLVRPTGLLDPPVTIRPVASQVDDVLSEVRARAQNNERVLITTLTKREAEHLTEYLASHDVRVRYLHSDIDTVQRVEILRDLRLGEFDVLVGINLLREGLDIPEVSLVAIFDADREGFLRSESALIQIIGRASRNLNGAAIMYADKITNSMRRALDETDRRRNKQLSFNKKYNIVPEGVHKKISNVMGEQIIANQAQREKMTDNKTNEKSIMQKVAEGRSVYGKNYQEMSFEMLKGELLTVEECMYKAAADLDFEKAAELRDELKEIKSSLLRSTV